MPGSRIVDNVVARYLHAVLAGETSGASDADHTVVLHREIVGSREFRAEVVGLAIRISGEPDNAMIVLAARFPRMTRARIQDEWRSLTKVLRPDVVPKLGLMAFAADGPVVQPEDAWLLDKVATVDAELPSPSDTHRASSFSFAWTAKTFSVWRALLDAWLTGEGSLQVTQLCERSGCSHPTVRSVVDYMKSKREVTIESDRSVILAALPRQSLDEVVVNIDRLRRTRRYVDATGLPGNPDRLLRRVLARGMDGVLVGGVAAARHYLTSFDLNGLPRLDVSVTPANGLVLHDLDPALAEAVSSQASPVLVVHETSVNAKHRLPATGYAAPSEVLLDLLELRLNEQALDFAAVFRRLHGARRG